MDADAALALVDALVFVETGTHLNDLKSAILHGVWRGQKYSEIANQSGYTEGHIKDVGAELWRLLSEVCGEKVTKGNCRSVLKRYAALWTDQLPQSPRSLGLENNAPIARLLTSEPSNFVGRSAAIAHLDHLMEQGHQIIVIQGEGGIGKTTLAQHYLQLQFEQVFELLMAKETQDITPVDRVVEEWLKQEFGEEPGQEFGVTLGRLKRQLHRHRVGILIDNLEPALDRQGRFIPPHRAYVELLRILADPRVQSMTLITSRDRLCEPDVSVEHYRLPGLDPQAWQQFFSSRGLTVHPPTLEAMHKAYGGNAKAMGILCGTIREDFDQDMAAYWQDRGDDPLAATALQNLVASQIHRLQSLDPDAYRLLCRLSCYRYQDVPTVPTEGLLCLLWDVPEIQRKQLIEALRNRSLVECQKGEYWLHPAIRAAAIARLRASKDWEEANRRAAHFWTDHIRTIETTADALAALEAYYHYVAIQDYTAAGRVILTSRNNQWQQFLPLGSTLYRMGLLRPVLAAITQIIDPIKSEPSASELYNILGDLYWITGQIHLAIQCQENAIAIATDLLNLTKPKPENRRQIYYLNMIKIDSLLSIGLYKIDLWELQEAAHLFQKVIQLAQDTDHFRWAEKATVCLALVHSYLDCKTEAREVADPLYHSIQTHHPAYTGRFAYFMQILGQTYANLGEWSRASELYDRAIAFAEESHYPQVKARSLTGLAEIHRQKGHYSQALKQHRAAIEILDQIGAKCDLAEAHFQLGLTYRAMNQITHSEAEFQLAIQLFSEMNAPEQAQKIDRIRLYR